jgi:hypothetical protein
VSGETSRVAKLPKCALCDALASFDAKTRSGPWAYLCDEHFEQHGYGLGHGLGQRLVLDS